MSVSQKRKGRRIGGGDDSDLKTTLDQDAPAQGSKFVRRPNTKLKQTSKLRLSFNPDTTSMNADDDNEAVIVKRPDARKRAIAKNAFQQSSSNALSSETPAPRRLERAGTHHPSYDPEHLLELRQSTPSTPKELIAHHGGDAKESSALNIETKSGQLAVISAPFRIPTEAEIREKKERRARLGHNESEYIPLDPTEDDDLASPVLRTEFAPPLVSDNEECAEDFESFIDDGALPLGKRIEKEEMRKRRAEIKDLIDQAESNLEENESDHDRGVLYEATQTRAGMEGVRKDVKAYPRSVTPLRITPIPSLNSILLRLRGSLDFMEQSKQKLIHRLEELHNEKLEISQREGEIKTLVNDAGDRYERLKAETRLGSRTQCSLTPATNGSEHRGLEDLGSIAYQA